MFEKFDFIENVDLKDFSTMKVGGKAKYIIFPKNADEIKKILQICRKNDIKTFILGNGSNVLFDDKGFSGAIICLKKMQDITFLENNVVEVSAGVNLFALNMALCKHGLSGLEFCYGIPATIGGFLVMNGGCFEHEICEFVKEVKVLENGKIFDVKAEDCDFSYRHSNLQNCVVLSAKLQLFAEEPDKIKQNMDFYLNLKRKKQPCEFPSLGSVFKVIKTKPEIHPAKLIDKMHLKGVKIGGAEVSTKHAGFIVNCGNATSDDVLNLIVFLEQKLAEIGVNVEREIVVLKEEQNGQMA